MFVSNRYRGSITVSFVSAVDPSRAQQRQDHPASQPADRMPAPWFHPFPAGRSHPLAERSPLPCSSVEIVSAAEPPDCFRNEKPARCPCNNLQQCIYGEYTRSSLWSAMRCWRTPSTSTGHSDSKYRGGENVCLPLGDVLHFGVNQGAKNRPTLK